MEALSVSDYRNNLAAYFDQADKGQPVLIRRRKQLYTLTSVGREELTMTPALKKRIDEVEKACREGRHPFFYITHPNLPEKPFFLIQTSGILKNK